LKKLGLPLEHAPQISQMVKLGTQTYEELKQFSAIIEEALFKMTVHRDRAITYKTEEVQVTLVDEYYVEQDIYGVVTRQIARVRLFFLSFLSGEYEMTVESTVHFMQLIISLYSFPSQIFYYTTLNFSLYIILYLFHICGHSN